MIIIFIFWDRLHPLTWSTLQLLTILTISYLNKRTTLLYWKLSRCKLFCTLGLKLIQASPVASFRSIHKSSGWSIPLGILFFFKAWHHSLWHTSRWFQQQCTCWKLWSTFDLSYPILVRKVMASRRRFHIHPCGSTFESLGSLRLSPLIVPRSRHGRSNLW